MLVGQIIDPLWMAELNKRHQTEPSVLEWYDRHRA